MAEDYWKQPEVSADPVKDFEEERRQALADMAKDEKLKQLSLDWMIASDKYKYTYNFTWLGRPIIKYPADIIVQQEIMTEIKPDLVIEIGVAHGGSVLFSASMQKILGIENALTLGVDIEIREHNRREIERSPVSDGIKLIEGGALDGDVIQQVKDIASGYKTVLLILDSNHSHDHVLGELNAYSDLVTNGSYVILPDTFIEFFPKGYFSENRPWDVGNNPYTACMEFLKHCDAKFEIEHLWSDKALISETPSGYLRRVK